MSKLRITPIGTCRIHTPLRRATARYPIELDLRRNYGFVHTSDEALQQLRFLQGEKSFSPEAAPLVFRDADAAQLEAQQWEPADLHIVEISSTKRISCGPDVVQGNYVQRHFPDFFASRERSKTFWSLVKLGHRENLNDFLEAQPSFHLLGPDDRRLLRDLSMEQLSFKAIRSDMAEVVERLGKERVLFVTHVNALTPDGQQIPTRDRLIRWVKMAAEQIGVPVFDPTTVMDEVGQEAALENGGLDLTHYTLPFSDRLYDALHREHVAGRISADAAAAGAGDREDQQAGMLAAQFEATLVLGDFFGASRNVHQALEQSPEALPLIELRGLIRAKIGDYAGALSDLTRRGDEMLLSHNLRLALLEALAMRGRHEDALGVAQRLIAEEFEDAEVYRSAAVAAERSGRIEQAIGYYKQAFRKDRSDLSAALQALVLLRDHGSQAEADEWRSELLENIGKASSGAFELASWAVEHRDDDLFAAALGALADADKGATIDLAEDAAAAGMTLATARAIPVLAELGKVARGLAQRRTAILTRSLERMTQLLEQDRPVEAYELARALAQLGRIPNSQIDSDRLEVLARRGLAQITRHVRNAVRSAFAAGQPEQVLAAAAGAGDILAAAPDTAVIVARSLDSLGRQDEALALLRRVVADNPDSFSARRLAARYGALQRDYATALDLYGALKESDEYASIAPEVERFFAGAERRSLKRLRELIESGEYDGATELAAAITRQLGPLERTQRELARMARQLRLKLKEIDEGGGELEEREAILRRLVTIGPSDEKALRLLALELMRQFRFAEAAQYWEKLHLLDPENESADRNRVRCATLAQRRASISAPESNEVG